MSLVNEPNSFELKGKSISVSYATTSFTGEPTLTYTDGAATRSFRGQEIRQEACAIGRLVTVTLKQDADLGETTLTLLVPATNVGMDGADTPLTTTVIVTTHRSSIGGPVLVKGVLQTYRVEEVSGIARKVHF